MNLNVKDETATLKAVVLGESRSSGKTPTLEETFDAKSYESVKNNSYPQEVDTINEIESFKDILLKYDVEVLRPELIEDCNQIFTRDLAFVIEDKIINSNIIQDRMNEKKAFNKVFSQIDYNKIFNLPEKAQVEGGDVVLYKDTIFVGLCKAEEFNKYKIARTNSYALDYLREIFPEKNFISLDLVKNDTDPRVGVLHLDCTFMPVAGNKAILYKDGFQKVSDYEMLIEFFGRDNVFEVTKEEMYKMNTNIFSISPKVVVSEEKFTRLNQHLREAWGMTVETVPYNEISKMGGLLRCSTLPLVRQYD